MNRLLALLWVALLCTPLVAQRYTVSGYVTDAAAEETMIGATLYDRTSGNGTVTNAYGFYSLCKPVPDRLRQCQLRNIIK